MSFVYASFLRRTGEGLLQFDNRISHMLPVVSGTVFFDMQNYVRESGEFRVYIAWNAELSGMLQDRLPSGGYFVKATMEQAKLFHKLTDGLPVYMKLIAREGRLYPYRTYVMWNGRPFSVEFNGNLLIPVDYKAKAHQAKGEERPKKPAVCKEMCGSRETSFGSGYQLLLGSGGLYEWFRSSQRRAYGGSQRFQFGQAGSQRFLYGQTGSQGFLYGSFGSGRYLYGRAGSQGALLGASGSQSFLHGSNRAFFFGSGGRYEWFRSSQRRMYGGSERGFFTGSRRLPSTDICQLSPGSTNDDPPYWQFLPLEWQLINRAKRPCSKKGGNATFGYGLDLIDG